MVKLDTSKITGYDSMSAEDKVKALEAYEYEDNGSAAIEVEKLKKALSNANSEAAEWKRKHNALITEDEKKKQEDAERVARMEDELNELRKGKTISEYKSKFIAQGYSEDLAASTAAALADGDVNTVLVNQGKFLDNYTKQIKADLLKNVPTPPGGAGADSMTLAKLRGLSDSEQLRFASEHPDEYKALYNTKGD